MPDQPLEEPKDPKEAVEQERVLKLQKRLRLRDECKYILSSCPEFMEMIQKGVEAARRMEETAVDEIKPVEIIQRHTGAKKFGQDLLKDIAKMAAFTIPAKKQDHKPMYE